MEEIKFNKIILGKDEQGNVINYSYSLAQDLPPTLKELLDTGFIAISTTFQAEACENDEEDLPLIALYKSIECSDFDDSWLDESYFPIEYDPINGEKIVITIAETIDNTDLINKTEHELQNLYRKKRDFEEKALKQYNEDIAELEKKLKALYEQKGFY